MSDSGDFMAEFGVGLVLTASLAWWTYQMHVTMVILHLSLLVSLGIARMKLR